MAAVDGDLGALFHQDGERLVGKHLRPQVGMIVSMSGQGLERRKDTGRSDPSRGGVGTITRVNENWTADVEWHATGQSRQGYACGCVARGGKTRAFHLQVVPNNAILQPYVRGGGNVGGHNHNASNRTEQQYYGSGQAESVRESRMSDQKGGHGSGGNAYGGASSGQRGQGGGSYGLQGQAGGGYGQAGGSGGAGQHRQGSFMGNAGGAPGLQLETQREKFVLPSQPEMVRG